MSDKPQANAKDARLRRHFFTLYLFLLAALAINMGSTLLDLGVVAVPLRLAMAALMAASIALIFMRLRDSAVLVRLVAATSLLWVVFLFVLSFSDYLTR
ncbi:Caa(3)-type oxidase subunit IV [Alcanivorax sp. N3-2A]|nr:Caa(3)-type oxidase subunit IV [Alcanivorax sp. N3-2A]|tara:strand:- start:84467 stop:84763 length:297 start_codon:yes stop_codon:yes gene_type:complete